MSITYSNENGNSKKDIIRYSLPGGSVLRDTRLIEKVGKMLKRKQAAEKKKKAERFLIKEK